MVVIQFMSGSLGLTVALLAAHVGAKDLEITLWNSSDCARPSASTMSTILKIPRTHNDLRAVIGCKSFLNHNFNGWIKDTHSQRQVAFVDTSPIPHDCQLIFYNRGPTADQYPEQINTSPCWQPYRRVSDHSDCPSIMFNARDFAVSYCCDAACKVKRGTADKTNPVFPPAPPLRRGLPSSSVPREIEPKSRPRSPLQGKQSPKGNNNGKPNGLSSCNFKMTTPVRTTYLPEVQLMNARYCDSGPEFAGAACPYDVSFAADVQLMSTQSLSISQSIQAGLEGVLSETTTFGWERSKSVTHGQSIMASSSISLPQGRLGYATFMQVVQCANGTWIGCNVKEVTSLPNQQYCVPALAPFHNQTGNQQAEAVGIYVMVDVT